MACWEGKKYKLVKSEKFDDYMKELGELENFIYYFCYFSPFRTLSIYPSLSYDFGMVLYALAWKLRIISIYYIQMCVYLALFRKFSILLMSVNQQIWRKWCEIAHRSNVIDEKKTRKKRRRRSSMNEMMQLLLSIRFFIFDKRTWLYGIVRFGCLLKGVV